MTAESIRQKVREFQRRTNFGSTDDDNFAPWWIQQNFKLSDEEATMVSSDGSFNLGLDGFYIQEKEDRMILTLVQAKFSEEVSQIVKALTEIGRFIPKLSQILDSFDNPVENRDILTKRLKQRIKSTSVFSAKPLEISALVLSLNSGSVDDISPKIEKNKTELFNLFEKQITNPNIVFSLSVLTLYNLIENGKIDSRRPAKPFEIHFDGSDEIDMNNSTFLSGFGRLPDLVSLYEQKGNQLFEKNVRLYLFGKRNEVKGPAGKIKETLESINTGKFAPEKFAFLHNGVTIYSTKVKAKKKEKIAELVNPSVLNGCQTIKSAYFFYQDALTRNKLNKNIWDKIPVSIRIVATDDKELWREVAEANNRQNSMSAAALRANDEIQINLENKFKDAGVYYERQEGAFENLLREGKGKFQQKYSNSAKEPIYIDTLAQALICCSDIPLAYATRVSEIFEVKKLYDKVFSNKNLQNIHFLILAHNVRRVIEYAVRNAVPGNATKIYADFKGSKYRDLFTRLILKTIIKNNLLENYLIPYGNAVLSAQGKSATLLIDELRELIKSPGISLLQKVTETYRLFDAAGEKYYWEKQTNQNLYDSIIAKLKLGNVDILGG